MKLYEHQAKQLFHSFDLPKPDGQVVFSAAEAPLALKKLGDGPWVVKAQVLAGGRGKAGGVKVVATAREAQDFAETHLGKNLVTHQTGPAGEPVAAVLIERRQPDIQREMYVSIVLDRKAGAPVLIASKEGGVDIETLATEKPESLIRFPIDPTLALPPQQAREIAKRLDLEGPALEPAVTFLSRLVALFLEIDATLVEVNPWVLTAQGETIALDGKITTDDNALFRHADQKEWASQLPQSSAEKRAAEARLSYIKLDGTVGCMVNGAGLAMATMDLIKLHGAEPANFLDVGGGASADQVREAFEIILSDVRVQGILVNIFGGIMRCDVIAEGILAAVKQIQLKVPLVVRLEGTRAEEGKKILRESGLPVTPAATLSEAARLITEAVKGR